MSETHDDFEWESDSIGELRQAIMFIYLWKLNQLSLVLISVNIFFISLQKLHSMQTDPSQ